MLTTAQQKFLRSHAHHLSPVVWVGASGVTEALLNELSLTLDTHELIKVKLLNDDREQRQAMIDEILAASGAQKVQSIGKILVLYRANAKQPKIKLPR